MIVVSYILSSFPPRFVGLSQGTLGGNFAPLPGGGLSVHDGLLCERLSGSMLTEAAVKLKLAPLTFLGPDQAWTNEDQ